MKRSRPPGRSLFGLAAEFGADHGHEIERLLAVAAEDHGAEIQQVVGLFVVEADLLDSCGNRHN